MFRFAFFLACCLAVGPWVGPRLATAEEWRTSPFANQELLDKHLGPACDLVEEVTGHKFETRPTVRVSTPGEVAKVLAREFEVLPEEMIPADERKTVARAMAKVLMAKYEPATHTIHVLSGAIDLVHKLQKKLPRLGEDHLRVLLAHEATHALDFQRYDFMTLRTKLKGLDAHMALGAVVEGHAEFVAEEVARRWGLTPAFERLEKAIAGDDTSAEGSDTTRALRAAALSQIRFAYVQGHAFFAAVSKARGVEGVEAALRNPPKSSRQIENPVLWLDPSAVRSEPELGPIVESFRWLVAGPGWKVATSRMLAAALKSQALRVPETRRSEWLAGFCDAHLLQASHTLGRASLVVAVLLFDTPEHAALFAELDRLVVDAGKLPAGMAFERNEVTDGAGSEGRMPGFTMHRVFEMRGQKMDFRQQVTHHGRFAVEFLGINTRHLDRSHFDGALKRAVAWMDDPVAAARVPPPEAPELKSKRKTLKVSVMGPEGKPVPRARVHLTLEEDGTARTLRETLEDGQLKVVVARVPLRVWVSQARTEDGASLPFAPNVGFPVAKDAEHVQLKLAPGSAITGRVLEVDGRPAAGLAVRAQPAWEGDELGPRPPEAHGEAVTDAAGAFEILGLADMAYLLSIERDGASAHAETPRVRAGGEPTEVRLKPVVTVTLTLLAPDGSPVPGALVHATGGRYETTLYGASDKNGIVRLEGAARSVAYILDVDPREASGPVAARRLLSWKPQDQTIVLKAGWTLRGIVRGPDGPVRAQVGLRTLRGWRSVRTGGDGAFAFLGLPEGPASVVALGISREMHRKPADDAWTAVPQTTEPVTLALFEPKKPTDEQPASKEEERKPEPAGTGK